MERVRPSNVDDRNILDRILRMEGHFDGQFASEIFQIDSG